ncbi:MAG: hypothetical protein ACKPKO_06760, partial [Candidatus Fonsibacter sp.]
MGKKGKLGNADEIYNDFLIILYQDTNLERRERLTGIKRNYQLRVVLYTQARKQDPDREPFPQDKATERRIETRKRKYDRANHKGLLQYWTGCLTVKAHNDKVISQQKEKLTTRGTNEFKQLYRICMTDASFKERDLKAPGYLDGIYILDWTAIGAAAAAESAPADPEETPKRASGDKVAIQFKYCSHQLDLSKRAVREALQKGNHHVSKCWINTLYNNYEQTLLRSDKQKNLITRETI